ncbi:MAG: DNA internalization-related competence protein ComEC/Rec2 [Polaromonas sp.]|nr:DNA internalization-related competence protein ComEC/Rec2 [Polaromonas sp.]
MILGSTLGLIGLVYRFKGGKTGLFLCLLLSAALGFGLTGLRAGAFEKSALATALEGKDIVVTGQVRAMPQFGEDGLRFRFDVDSALLNGQAVRLPPQIYLGWYSGFGPRPVRTVVPVADGDPEPPEFSLELQRQPQNLRAGERWQMTVRLKAPHGNSNPHGFDYELWLWEQDIQATGYVRTGVRDAPPQKLAPDGFESLAHPVERARQAVREAIFSRVENRQLAGVLAALVVGDQNAIERADWDVFRATGVAHLMSISGLHITMFAWVASLGLGWLWRRSVQLTPALCLWLPASSAGALGGLALAALYALFSGWGVPAQRTIWMLATVVLLRQSGKQWPWPFVWLLAMAVVVVLDPWALMQAGFWLSFVAVGVLFATDSGANDARNTLAADLNNDKTAVKPALWASWLSTPLASLLGAAREQWIVTLALTPLSLLLFNQVSLVGLLANAVAIPWVTLVLTPLAMLGVLWAPFWDAAAWSVSLLTLVLRWLAAWPLASISVAAAPLWCALAGVLGGALLAMRLPWHWRALGVPLLLPVLLWQPVRPGSGQFEILGADIGQGNALIVRTASHSMVYDTGPRFSRESDAGHRVLVPLLRAMGERIDMLMLSHRDLDHIGGAPAVLAMQPQARLVSSIEDSHELQNLRKSERCVVGQHWQWDGVDFEVLHPTAADYDIVNKSNAMSCVLRISNGRQTALLAGDLESPQELRLVANPQMAEKLKADFLLMPHHGSKTSSSAAFLDAVKPQFALAQAGYRNRFNHPVESVLERYRERGINIVKSPVCGAAIWHSGQPDQLLCHRERALRYWHHRPESGLQEEARR